MRCFFLTKTALVTLILIVKTERRILGNGKLWTDESNLIERYIILLNAFLAKKVYNQIGGLDNKWLAPKAIFMLLLLYPHSMACLSSTSLDV